MFKNAIQGPQIVRILEQTESVLFEKLYQVPHWGLIGLIKFAWIWLHKWSILWKKCSKVGTVLSESVLSGIPCIKNNTTVLPSCRTLHTVSFLFKFSGPKKLVKWSGYKTENFISNFCQNSTFYKSFLTTWRQNAALALMSD